MMNFTMSGGFLDRHEEERVKPHFLSSLLSSKETIVRLLIIKNSKVALFAPANASDCKLNEMNKQVCADTNHENSAIVHGKDENNNKTSEAAKLTEQNVKMMWYTTEFTKMSQVISNMHELIYLGQVPHTNVHYVAIPHQYVQPRYTAELTIAETKSKFITTLRPEEQAIVGLALSLSAWHGRSLYCSKCGKQTSSVHDLGFSRKCTQCKTQHFPQIMPAILVAVFDGKGNVLLSQRHRKNNTLTILSGFIHHGESAEEALVREVKEETNINVDVKSIRYIGSQPWPYPYLLMLCYYAVASSSLEEEVAGEQIELKVQEKELVKVMWVSKDDVKRAMNGIHPDMRIPPQWTAAYQMLKPWVDGEIDDFGHGKLKTFHALPKSCQNKDEVKVVRQSNL